VIGSSVCYSTGPVGSAVLADRQQAWVAVSSDVIITWATTGRNTGWSKQFSPIRKKYY